MKIFNFFRKNLINCIIVLLAVVTLSSAAAFCWLAKPEGFTLDFKSSTATAYFAGGDGSKDDPYQINNPIHLYNLAWLQYLGYFNLRSGANNGRAQSYFVLTADIAMDNLTLPPIGTAEYPFIGHFNGSDYAVTGLVVSNGLSDFTVYPKDAKFTNNTLYTYGNTETVSYLGMFGVTGNYNTFVTNSYTTTVHSVSETLAESITPSKDEFYMSEMSVSRFYLDTVEVKSCASTSLVGLVAGYVCSNLENIGVYQSKISFTSAPTSTPLSSTDSVVSRYGIVGATDDNSVVWTTEGETPGKFGGTIDMRTLAKRVNYMMSATGDSDDNMTTFMGTTSGSMTGAFKNTGYNFYAVSKSTTDYVFHYNYSGDKYTQAALLGGTFTTSSGSFEGYTVLPLNVDESAMGLDSDNESTDKYSDITISKMYARIPFKKNTSGSATLSKSARNINDEYYSKTSEVEESGNTGYIVGLGNGTSGAVLLDVRGRSHNTSIKNSFGSNYDDSSFAMLAYVKNEGEFRFIEDSNNKDSSTRPSSYDYVSLENSGLSNDGGVYHYETVRANSKFDSCMGIGDGNTNIYGLMFYNGDSMGYGQSTSRGVIEYNNKKLVTGALNFSAKESGIVTAVVGTYKGSVSQYLFGLYRVKDTSFKETWSNGKTDDLYEIEKVYKSGDTYVMLSAGTYYTYDKNGNQTASSTSAPSIATDANLAFDKTWYYDSSSNSKGKIPAYYACYVEIPVPKGDYVIMSDEGQNGLLMYLDIGTSGGSSDKQFVANIDFVNYCNTTALKNYYATNNAYPAFDDVTAQLSSVSASAYIYFKRKSTEGATFPESSSKLGYLSESLIVTFNPSAEEDTSSKWD